MANQLLLVDDSPLIHRVVELTFEGHDFSIRTADTPEQALALARSLKPDIIVASADMKGAAGAEICRRLRQEGELGEVPVLLLTSAKSRMSGDEARQAGAAGVLVKPFEPEKLLAEVERALARGGSEAGAAAGGSPVAAASAAGGTPGQEPSPGLDLFEEQEIESLFAGGTEEPSAQAPPPAQDESDLLLQAEKALGQAEPAAGGKDVRLFDDSELEDLFGGEAGEKPSPPAAAPAPQEHGSEWADLDLEADLALRRPEAHRDLAELAREQASAAEAQLAEIEAEFAAGGSPTEADVQAAESQIENLQEELSRDLAGAGNIQLPKRQAAPPPAPVQADPDDDLLGLAAEAGFRGPSRPEAALDSSAGKELDLEAELLAAAGVAGPAENPSAAAPPAEELAIDSLLEADFSLPAEEPGGEIPVWDVPLTQKSVQAAAQPPAETGAPRAPDEKDVEPLVRQSLERTVEAIVPALIRNIEALVVRQLPDLVEKIVLREIEKIKRGE